MLPALPSAVKKGSVAVEERLSRDFRFSSASSGTNKQELTGNPYPHLVASNIHLCSECPEMPMRQWIPCTEGGVVSGGTGRATPI